MSREKQCPARAVVFADGEKHKVRCVRHERFHHDQDIAERGGGIVALPHLVYFSDRTRSTWERDGDIVYV